jgi:hypothetical protein
MQTDFIGLDQPLTIRSYRDLIEVTPRMPGVQTVAVFPVRSAYQSSPQGDPRTINDVRLVMYAARIQRELSDIAVLHRAAKPIPGERLAKLLSLPGLVVPVMELTTAGPWKWDGGHRISGVGGVVAVVGDPVPNGLPAMASHDGFARWICLAPDLFSCAKKVVMLTTNSEVRSKVMRQVDELLYAVDDCW